MGSPRCFAPERSSFGLWCTSWFPPFKLFTYIIPKAICCFFCAWVSDKTKKRAGLIAVQTVVTTVGLILVAYAKQNGVRYFGNKTFFWNFSTYAKTNICRSFLGKWWRIIFYSRHPRLCSRFFSSRPSFHLLHFDSPERQQRRITQQGTWWSTFHRVQNLLIHFL